MPIPIIDELYPEPTAGLDREALLARYGRPGARAGEPWIRVNFVATLDGSVTGADDRSGSISSAADKAVFGVLRRLADVVLVAAGTVRHEDYHGSLVSEGQRAWRVANGLAEHPGFAIASRTLDLDPTGAAFADAPVRPLVLTVAAAPAERRSALAEVAEVVDCGDEDIDPARLRALFAERGQFDILCEGGPSFLGSLAAGDGIDELCLTVAPLLVAGDGPRLARGEPAALGLRIAHVLRSESDDLILRYTR